MTSTDTPNQERLKKLGYRQQNMIIYLARGQTIQEIAELTGVHFSSVKVWAERLRRSLDVRRTTEIPYAYYLATGINPFEMEITSDG